MLIAQTTTSAPTTTTSSSTTTTTTTVPGKAVAVVTHLSGTDWIVALSLTVGLVLIAGIVVAGARSYLEGRPPKAGPDGQAVPTRPPDKTLIRSWIAISLAGGLLLFCAISFGIDDTTLRSTLIGGLVANAGVAIAFYFASAQTRQLLNAAVPTTLVPNLLGKNEHEVNSIMATTTMHLLAQPSTRKENATVVLQDPPANQAVPPSTQIKVEFGGPVPDIVMNKMTPPQAEAALKEVNLELKRDPSDADDKATATAQVPRPQEPIQNKTVTVTFAPPPP